MEFLPSAILRYSESHTQPESGLLRRINRETNLHVLMPRMISGHLQGRVLSMLSHMVRPRRILEIGTYTGYATLCLAEGLASDGFICTIDCNEELRKRVEGYFAESAYAGRIDYRTGNARDVLPTLTGTWDLVFLDADKESYLDYYEWIVPAMAPGGYLIADNVLWSGSVADPEKTDVNTEKIRAFNHRVQHDPRVENVLFPIRDGLMVARKL
ncbi:MAG: O-methyltransferase [Cyclobacteriaceae bacterium]|nr:O-methyltransferase [Cyclobacteriaceae bacterium]